MGGWGRIKNMSKKLTFIKYSKHFGGSGGSTMAKKWLVHT